MSNIKESLINECVGILKRDDVKEEVKELFRPIIDLILQEIYPYIFLSMIFVIISFLLILGIFILLLRNNNYRVKIPGLLKFS
jgi:hypothetical protein